MPLETSNPAVVSDEVNYALDFQRKHTTKIRDISQRFIGNWYRTDMEGDESPENLISNYITFAISEVAFNLPEVTVTADMPITHGQIAEFMQIGLATWIRISGLKIVQSDIVRDMLMGFGVAKVCLEPRDAYLPSGQVVKGGRLVPVVCRVAPDRFLIDPRCDSPETARVMGDVYMRDVDSMWEDEQWDAEALMKLKGWNFDSDGTDNNDQSIKAVPDGVSGPRRMVKLADIWVRETGELITLAMSSSDTCESIILRRMKYHGPDSGPYHIFGINRVPDDPYPISNIQFCMEQYESLQQHAASADEASKTYKRFVVVEAANTDAQAAVMDADNGSVVVVRGLAGAFQQIELGGPNPEQLQYVGICRDRYDRVLGLGDAQRGRTANVTATESRIAQNNVDSRMEWLHTMTEYHTTKVLEKVGWYLFYDENVSFPVAYGDQNGETVEGVFIGGAEDNDGSWMEYHLEIACDSMRREDPSENLAKSLQLLQIAPQVVQLMMQMPMVNIRFIVDELGKSMGYKNLTDRLFDPQFLMQLRQDPTRAFNPASMNIPMGVNPMLQQHLQMRGAAISDLPSLWPAKSSGEYESISKMMKSGGRNATGTMDLEPIGAGDYAN